MGFHGNTCLGFYNLACSIGENNNEKELYRMNLRDENINIMFHTPVLTRAYLRYHFKLSWETRMVQQ